MWRRIWTPLSALQIASMLCLLALVLVLARLFHHQTDNVFVDFWDYVGSFQIAFPPLTILLLSYILAFLGGKKLADIPADVVSFFKNRFFQSFGMMVSAIAFLVTLCTVTLYFTETRAPPAYEKLVASILASEIDKSEDAKNY